MELDDGGSPLIELSADIHKSLRLAEEGTPCPGVPVVPGRLLCLHNFCNSGIVLEEIWCTELQRPALQAGLENEPKRRTERR